MNRTSLPSWLTVQEVAGRLRVSKDVIYDLAQDGAIPATKIGGQWRFRADQVEKWALAGGVRDRRSRSRAAR